MTEYEIKYEPIILEDGSKKDKWNIYYYINDREETCEFYSYDGINPANNYKIKENYKLKTK